MPIRNREKTYGVIIFDCEGWTLSEEEKIYVDTVISQLTLVIERELLSREKENTRIQVERERLKSTLLRSISHDLRTPLTGITGSAGFLLDNLGIMDEATIKSMLKDICSDSEWLSTMVENLLNLTRIQEGRLDINKKKEVVDDLVASAVRLVSNRVGNHILKMETPEDILLVSVDGRLFIQVLVNLLDNAFRHSGTGTTVTLRVKQDGNCLKFVVSDNGIGIPNDKIDKIFDNFFTTAYENGDKQRGVGLGLTICKAMVEAQGGTIRAFNSPQGGAVFEVSMPMEDRKDE
ncbi:sensor histidine kinase [Enterocloster bolteae]|uniref:sensor histidine kinase n=1 Tax=Enterocloster bolteae TaxID=208479 RepID=UPI002F3E519E